MKIGVGYAILAYISWGLLPLYWKWFDTLSAGVLLGHRIVWSFAFVVALLLAANRGRLGSVKPKSKAELLAMVAASALISVNWLIFIYAVKYGHVVEASLGYYINPLMNVVLAVFFLKERPTSVQWTAIALAAAGVFSLTATYGKPPWIALSLAVSFALYGLVKKKTTAGPAEGLFWETAFALPAAALYLAFAGGAAAPLQSPSGWALLLSGAATTLPLLWFAAAAKRLTLTTIGLIQYMSPTLTLAIGVLLFREPFTATHLWSFAFIWGALALYTAASLRRMKLAAG